MGRSRWRTGRPTLAALPRGISRHVVRFVRLPGRVIAIKEITANLARARVPHAAQLLDRLDLPAVEPVGGRQRPRRRRRPAARAALVTRHLQYSLPYRALFPRRCARTPRNRLIDALALLLVRLHLTGFYWGDVSLSNTLFRRDAGAFAAYLVDAETGELHHAV